MFAPRVLATALLLGSLALPGRAFAVVAGLQARLSLFGGWTDNVFNAADHDLTPMARGRESDLTFGVSPSLILAIGSARAVARLSYDFGATFLVRHSELDTFSNALRLDTFFIPSGNTFLQVGGIISQARLNALNTGLTSIEVTPVGLVDVFQVAFSERFAWDITARWRFAQSANLNLTLPLATNQNNATNEVVDFGLGLEAAWKRDLAILEVGLTFANYAQIRGQITGPDGRGVPNGELVPLRRQFITPILLRWRHDLTRSLTSELAAGFVSVVDAKGGGYQIEPIGIAGLYYFNERINAQLSYVHSATANTVVGATYFGDAVTLNAVVPFGATTGLSLTTLAGYQFVRQVDVARSMTPPPTGTPVAGTTSGQLVRAEISLGWSPKMATRWVQLGLYLRYQLLGQWGHPGDAAPLPTYLRNSVLLGISGILPTESRVMIPNGLGRRADRSDAPYISPTGRLQ